MRLVEAKTQLEARINQLGIESHRPDPGLLWELFRDFVHLSFSPAFSAVRFMAGVSASPLRDIYYVEMGRQFSNRPFITPVWAGSSRDFYMVGIKLVYDPDEELIALIEQRFSNTSEHGRDFLNRLETSPIFKAAFHHRQPTEYELVTFGEPFETDEA